MPQTLPGAILSGFTLWINFFRAILTRTVLSKSHRDRFPRVPLLRPLLGVSPHPLLFFFFRGAIFALFLQTEQLSRAVDLTAMRKASLPSTAAIFAVFNLFSKGHDCCQRINRKQSGWPKPWPLQGWRVVHAGMEEGGEPTNCRLRPKIILPSKDWCIPRAWRSARNVYRG